ncbi:MAG: penicillin acylase family protein [Dehalococcoidia bacterium]|jgi:penicillin amidase
MPDTLTCPGLDAPLTIRRDAFGIAHIEAATEHDAWFGQGFAAAQDRLWQMEYDRRRAVGRWSEAAGPAGLAADRLAKRLGIESAARHDLEMMAPAVRAMFDAYAGGVNAFLASGPALPPEYALTGLTPEPWEPWQSAAVFKIRHVLMGLWQWKMACAGLLARVGPDVWRQFQFLPPRGSAVILPPGGAIARLYADANEEIAACAEHLGFVSEIEAGSNSWVVSGSRTTTGKPVLCNDSHRALDVPNAYWQVNVSCPAFTVAGATFAGFPGFPHFGFNGSVGWNITHTQADYQDLYVEKFEGPNAERYLAEDGWREAERRSHTINVRGAAPETVETWATRHGPVVHGDPRSGTAIALRYTALSGNNRPFDALRPMLSATTVPDLFETQRSWVDPVNNLVAADNAGNIGFMVRGELPIRASKAARRLPVPGWTGEHEWMGAVPFEQLPRAINPPEGFVSTANQRVIPGDEPYISAYFASPARADRLVELLGNGDTLSPVEIAGFQDDQVSRPARKWCAFLAKHGPFTGDAERARTMLAVFDGDLQPGRPEPLLYAFFRRALMRELFAPVAGEATWDWLTTDPNPGLGRIAGGLIAEYVAHLEDGIEPPAGRSWPEVLAAALERGWAQATAFAEADPATWRWGDRHATGSKHPLSAVFPDANLDPPRVPIGGDGDTLKNATYGLSGKNDFVLASVSVYRQVIDFAHPDDASYIVPGGASGDPRSPHFADQLGRWANCERIPMHRLPEQAREAAASELALRP